MIMAWNDIRYYIPSFSGLFKSFKLRGKEYLRENTLHGFIYFINPYRPMWERIIWFICTITSFGTAVGFIVTIWQRFQSTPTLTDLDIETESMTIVYPGFHLCMTSEHLNVTVVPDELGHIFQEYYDWNWDFEPTKYGNITLPIPLSDIFLRITPDCTELLVDCSDTGSAIDCGQLFTKILTPVGICCKTVPKKFTYDEYPPVLSFVLTGTKALNLYVHDIDEPPLRSTAISYRLNRNVSLILEMHVTKAQDDLRMLSRAQRDCVFIDEWYSYNDCYRLCMKKKAGKSCTCVLWFENSVRKEKECGLNEYLCFSEKMRKSDCSYECYLFCEHTDYMFAKIENSETATSIAVWWPTVVYIRKVRFGWLDLMVSFGGVMGLFIGYSILTTVELSYYFSLRSYCGAIQNQNHLDNIVRIRVAEKEKPKVIALKYYDYVE